MTRHSAPSTDINCNLHRKFEDAVEALTETIKWEVYHESVYYIETAHFFRALAHFHLAQYEQCKEDLTHVEGDCIKTVKSYKRPKEFYFLRAESFYNVASYMDGIMPVAEQGYGGKSLHEQSHGESFIATLTNKFHGNGLYIMDEPEAALSPMRQMAMLARMHQLVQKGSQFIIATHSPILMAYPNAKIIAVDEGKLVEMEYQQTEHYLITKRFLNNHTAMVEQLLSDD